MLSAEKLNKKRKNKELKLPTIQDDDLSMSIHSNITNRLFSAKSIEEKKKHLNSNNIYKNMYTDNEGTSNKRKSTDKYLKIPRIRNRRGNVQLEDSSVYSNTKNDSQSNECKSGKLKSPNSNNIINIVNNVNGRKDKNNNIGLKVNINRYDIKCYIPPNKKNTDKNNSGVVNINSSNDNDSSKSSHEIIINDENKNKGINVDIINFSRKGTKKTLDNSNKNNLKAKEKDEIALEKNQRRKILHRIKSMNNLYRVDKINGRLKLESDSFDSNDPENAHQKVLFKRLMSKEINFNNFMKQDYGFDKINSDNYLNEDNLISKKNKNKNNKDFSRNGDNSINFNSNNTKKFPSNTSVEKFGFNFITKNSKNVNNILIDKPDFLNKNKNLKDASNNESNMNKDNSEDNNLQSKRKGKIKEGEDGFSHDENSQKRLKNKRKKRIKNKDINENGEEISFSIEVTDSQYDSDEHTG